MKIRNYQNYGMCIYNNVISDDDTYQLGDVVINSEKEIGVVIQVHSPIEFRADTFGNFSAGEVRLATFKQVLEHRHNISNEGKFTHSEI